MGTPGEESPSYKVTLAKDGAFDGYEFAAMAHMCGGKNVTCFNTLAVSDIRFTFKGRSSHASSAPEEGLNALNAVRIFMDAMDMWRQHLPSDCQIHGIVQDGGIFPSVVPEKAVLNYWFRAEFLKNHRDLEEKACKCAQGAALCTGTTVTWESISLPTKPLFSTQIAKTFIGEIFEAMGDSFIEAEKAYGSTDVGDVNLHIPAIHPMIDIAGGERIVLHDPLFTKQLKTENGYRGMCHGRSCLLLSHGKWLLIRKCLWNLKNSTNKCCRKETCNLKYCMRHKIPVLYESHYIKKIRYQRRRCMFKNVIVRRPGKSLINGITSAVELGKPDYEKALAQHENYVRALTDCGVLVTILDQLEMFPDSCFVEDTAVLTKNCAIISNPGADSRNRESNYMIDTIREFYMDSQIEYIRTPGTLEGGDVMMVGNHFYVGLSARTNEEGCRQFINILEKHGHTGSVIPLREVLHLKTGLAYLENNILLISGEFVEIGEFKDFDKIIIPENESYAANCIWVNETILIPEGFKQTEEMIRNAGLKTVSVDVSEYRKLDGGLSCLSLRF